MKALLRTVNDHGETYDALLFVCPGCVEGGGSGFHMLPVNSPHHSPSWTWNGDLEAVTLSPSILTRGGPDGSAVCHSFLTDGVFNFLTDCTHSMAGQRVPLPDFPQPED